MAIAGAWRARQSDGPLAYNTNLDNGTGWNPIHRVKAAGRGRSGMLAHDQYGSNASQLLPQEMIDEFAPENLGYTPEDECSTIWGYGVETGTADRPSTDYADSGGNIMGVVLGFPSYGTYMAGVPGGTEIRSIEHGGIAGYTGKEVPREDVAQGWVNKVHSSALDAETSDKSQYEMQTSMVQRDKTLQGSQASGRASEYSAPIKSRVPGMRERVYAALSSHRHYDMFPYQQEAIIRPFWVRTAGTGYREWMYPNDMYVSEPLQRTPPGNAYQGREQGASFDELPADSHVHGYMDEDVIW